MVLVILTQKIVKKKKGKEKETNDKQVSKW